MDAVAGLLTVPPVYMRAAGMVRRPARAIVIRSFQQSVFPPRATPSPRHPISWRNRMSTVAPPISNLQSPVSNPQSLLPNHHQTLRIDLAVLNAAVGFDPVTLFGRALDDCFVGDVDRDVAQLPLFVAYLGYDALIAGDAVTAAVYHAVHFVVSLLFKGAA